MNLITVIVPVYNEKDWVRRCLSSLAAQSHKCDVIVVDDGSTDGSGEICEEYRAYGYKIIHTKNKGVSAARNLGIELATTPYVAFLDSDDHWEPYAVEILEKNIMQFPQEGLISFNHLRQYKTGGLHAKYMVKRGVYTYDKLPAYWECVWNKVFRREFLIKNNLRFRDCLWGEDALFVYECVLARGQLLWLNDVFCVHHFDNPRSLRCMRTDKRHKQLVRVAKELIEELESKGIAEEKITYVRDVVERYSHLK